jgi:hypothetical protein
VVGRVNHRGWIVLESISSSDGMLCVDFFDDPEDRYGFEHFRCDPEDQGRWIAIGGYASLRFESAMEAAEAAAHDVAWAVVSP